MDFGIYAGDTNATIYVRLRDSTTGLAKTGLAYNSAGVVCSYVLPGAARAAITLATQTVTGAHSDGGFVEVDATNCKGLYRLDLPDAAIASGSYTLISIEFDGVIEETVSIPLHLRKVNMTQLSGSATPVTNLNTVFNTDFGNNYDTTLYAWHTDVIAIKDSSTAANNLKNSCLAMASGTVTADGSNSATSFKVDATLGAKTTDYFGSANGGLVLVFIAGTTNEFQSRRVTGFNGTTDFITVEEAFTGTPTASDTFILIGRIEV